MGRDIGCQRGVTDRQGVVRREFLKRRCRVSGRFSLRVGPAIDGVSGVTPIRIVKGAAQRFRQRIGLAGIQTRPGCQVSGEKPSPQHAQ